MSEKFLLRNDTAVKLYHEYAKDMPIIDYHCHLSPREIYEDKRFKNITEIWLYGDHYKWRAMRSNGVDERYVTGDVDDYNKFVAWAKTVPMTIGNPLYHWTHMELRKYFNIYEVLNEKSAPAIWEKANAKITQEGFSARQLILKSNVKVICTTDDPIDSLEYHIKLKEEKDFDVKVLPTLRPDKGLDISSPNFKAWVEKLGQVTEKVISSYDLFLAALQDRIKFFHSVGCRISDHALDRVYYMEASKEEVDNIFSKALKGEVLDIDEVKKYKTYTLRMLGRAYHEYGWVMQLHIGAMRNTNTRMAGRLGPDTGFDSVSDHSIAYPLIRFLDSLEITNSLPKTILYTLNPADNYVLATALGNFQGEGIPGKIQFGSAWWFNDNKEGMLEQMKSLANVGLLSRFVGMLTDSRSFLSYPRHDYFRRILCNFLGEMVEAEEAPEDMELLGDIVQGICYNNAKEYFEMGL